MIVWRYLELESIGYFANNSFTINTKMIQKGRKCLIKNERGKTTHFTFKKSRNIFLSLMILIQWDIVVYWLFRFFFSQSILKRYQVKYTPALVDELVDWKNNRTQVWNLSEMSLQTEKGHLICEEHVSFNSSIWFEDSVSFCGFENIVIIIIIIINVCVHPKSVVISSKLKL